MIVGIDPSLTATCLAYCKHPPEPLAEALVLTTISTKAAGHDLLSRFSRYRHLVREVIAICNQAGARRIILEGYSFGSQGNATTWTHEYGALLRESLSQRFDVREVPPTTIKKFATGKGNADKMAVAVAITKRWGLTLQTSDEYDATACCLLGMVEAGQFQDCTTEQLKIATEAVNPTKKVKA